MIQSLSPQGSRRFNYNPQDRLVQPQSGTISLDTISLGEFGPCNDHLMLREKLEPSGQDYVYPDGDPRQNSSLAFASAALTIQSFLEVFPEPIRWAFDYDKLLIRPNCGKDLNANYKRDSGTINFYEDSDPIRKAQVHSGASADIVSHEVGHALLDAIRPEYMNAWGPEPAAFHESFGDMIAIHMALRDPTTLQETLRETGGDLSRPNRVAQVAEELGTAINHQAGKNDTGGNYLRNANNPFKYTDPSLLPSERGGAQELGWGKHSFSRIWTGAHFDLLKAMVAEGSAQGLSSEEALRQSNEELFGMLARLVRDSPRGKFTYKDMALQFLRSDLTSNQGRRVELIQRVFQERGILPADLPAIEPLEDNLFKSRGPAFQEVTLVLGPNLGQFAGAQVKVPVGPQDQLFKSEALQASTEADMQRLIKAGKIRYNDPNYRMSEADHLNPQGESYYGAVTWEDGQMRINRLAIGC